MTVNVELRPGQAVKRCECCGKEFIGRSDAQYCSEKCKVRAWRDRQKPKKPAK